MGIKTVKFGDWEIDIFQDILEGAKVSNISFSNGDGVQINIHRTFISAHTRDVMRIYE